MFSWWFAIPFWQRVLGAFIVGAALGWAVPHWGVAMQPFGQLFIQAIQMLVVPLILSTIVSAITSLAGQHNVARLATKTIGLFVLTAFIASAIGLTVASLVDLSPATELTAGELVERDIPPFSQVLLDIIPQNPIAAMVEGNVLQIIVFAALLGVAINTIGDKGAPLRRFFQSAADVMFQVTRYVLELTPLGVFGLMAWVVGSYGLETLLPLGKFIGAIYLACIVHMVLTYGGLVRFAGKMKPLQFLRAVFPTQVIAYSTSSSYGTLPSTLQTATQRLGVQRDYASFSLPLGATINMDGCGGIYPAIAAIFIAQLYGIPLGWAEYGIIMITATIAAIGTAGVPGSAMVMLTVTLTAVGLPLEGIAFIAAVDRIIDMMRTATNVTGDLVITRVVAQSEGLLEPQSAAAADEPRAIKGGVGTLPKSS